MSGATITRDDLERMLLLDAAVQACRERGHAFVTHPYKYPDTPGATACAWFTVDGNIPKHARADTLTEALRALLAELGVEPPEWPGCGGTGQRLEEVR